MKTTIIALPVFFQKDFLAIIKKSAISTQYLGKDQEDHTLFKISYAEEKQPVLDKIIADIKLINLFINEVSSAFEKYLLSFCTEIGGIMKRLDIDSKLKINEISKN